MNQETFHTVVKLNERLQKLEYAKEKLSVDDNKKPNLVYAIFDGKSSDGWVVEENFRLFIKDILVKHEKQIQEDIATEIDRIKQEIEKL